jgi:nicotinate-nucleotide adenylyltransferase
VGLTPAHPRRVGLFGGSFDPIHNAHLQLARTALTALNLAEVRLIPAGNPWQRPPLCASAPHRLAMVRLAIAGEQGLSVDDCEVQRQGPSYTIDTLAHFAAQEPQAQPVLLLGADQWARLHTWHRWQDITAQAQIAVAQRGNTPVYTPPELAHTHFAPLPMPAMPHSSTQIRALLANGASVTGLLPERVAQYIAQHQLYRKPHEH